MPEMKPIFVTGIGTDIGKTVCSAILVEALKADYWKPIQAGNLEFTDCDFVKKHVLNSVSRFHPERFRLKLPQSPHAAANAEGIQVQLHDFSLPETNNQLIIEGAGGLMVPINSNGDLIIDLIQYLNCEVILISKNYLGSINHTLLSAEALKNRNMIVKGILFNGPANNESEEIILQKTGFKNLGRINQADIIDSNFILKQAEKISAH